MSSLACIDFDEAERQRAQRIMALFQERESRDELGLGAIRASIADHLFPGTSTIQTRLRYMLSCSLAIPWLFHRLEGRDIPQSQLHTEARALEIQLIEALKSGGESNGIIGLHAGARLQRLPSSVYWAGLGAWGIRLFTGSIDSLFVSLGGMKRLRVSSHSEDAAADPRMPAIWNQSLPQSPKDLLARTEIPRRICCPGTEAPYSRISPAGGDSPPSRRQSAKRGSNDNTLAVHPAQLSLDTLAAWAGRRCGTTCRRRRMPQWAARAL